MTRFWLALLDAAHSLLAPRPVYMWLLGRAAKSVHYETLTGSTESKEPW